MRRGQAFFMALFTLVVLIVFVGIIYIGIIQAGDFDQKPTIGEKQQEVLNTYDAALALQQYMQHAAESAARTATREPDIEQSIEEHARELFTPQMRAYPLLSVHTQFTVEREGNELVFRSEEPVQFAIGEAPQITRRAGAQALGSGILTTWPSDEFIITNIFGERTIARGSRFHAGIDIRARPFGVPVYAVGSGQATPSVPIANAVSLRMENGWTCEYLHVAPLQDTSYSVLEGEVIAHVTDDGYDAHLDLRCYNHEEPLLTQQATNLFGPQYVAASTEAQIDTMKVAVREARNVGYIDPFCLFSPDIRAMIDYDGGPALQSQLDRREGVTQAEKEAQTCEAYVRAGIIPGDEELADASPPEIEPIEEEPETSETPRIQPSAVTDQRFETTMQNLHDNTISSGMTLYEYSAQVAAQEGISHEAVIAMIVVESLGDPEAVSPTGVVGIMQVQCDVTADTLGVPHLKEDLQACNQVRRNPEQSILSGTRHWASILRKYDGFTHQVAFAAAEYNAGPHILPLIERTGSDDPSYEQVMRLLTPSYLADRAALYRGWTAAQRQNKVEEIRNHGLRVARYYQMAGGSAAPPYVSSPRQTPQRPSADGVITQPSQKQTGVYELTLEARVPVDTTARTRLINIQTRANQIPVREQQEQYLASQSMGACGDYDEALTRATQHCLEYFEAGCACPIPLPDQDFHTEQALPSVVSLYPFSAEIVQGGENHTAFLDWLGPAPDEEWDGSLGVLETSLVPEIPPSTSLGQRLLWDFSSQDSLRVLQTGDAVGGSIPLQERVAWVVYDESEPAIVAVEYPPACALSAPLRQQYTLPRKYCSDAGSIWVDVRQEAPEVSEEDLLGGFDPFEQLADILTGFS